LFLLVGPDWAVAEAGSTQEVFYFILDLAVSRGSHRRQRVVAAHFGRVR